MFEKEIKNWSKNQIRLYEKGICETAVNLIGVELDILARRYLGIIKEVKDIKVLDDLWRHDSFSRKIHGWISGQDKFLSVIGLLAESTHCEIQKNIATWAKKHIDVEFGWIIFDKISNSKHMEVQQMALEWVEENKKDS